MADTHINAFYAELAEAEKELAVAKGKVQGLKDQISAMGGALPGEELEPEVDAELDTKEEEVSVGETSESDEPASEDVVEPSGAEPAEEPVDVEETPEEEPEVPSETEPEAPADEDVAAAADEA